MKKIYFFTLYLLIIFSSPINAQDDLRVAVTPFAPPFVMESANHQYYGFDVAMMEYICRTIKRNCIFVPMRFVEMIDAVADKKVDIAVTSLTITSERLEKVNFSIPYLLSQARFITPTGTKDQNLNIGLLNDSTIGIRKGTIFPFIIKSLGVQNPKIIEFDNDPAMIDALQGGKIKIVLMDSPSATYWQSQSSKILKLLGKPFTFGFGFAIAVNRDQPELLDAINEALIKYQNGPDFKRDYNMYILNF